MPEQPPEGFAEQQAMSPAERTYTPFPRLRERNPHRLLGIANDASFDEAVEAKRYLMEEYKWHEPSREAIELAYESIIAQNLKARKETGYNAGIPGRRGVVDYDPSRESLPRKVASMFDPTVTLTTLINEGIVFAGLALWCLTTSDQSFPLAGAFAYSVYKLHSKRSKRNPDGPHFGGNPIVGALLGTLFALALGGALTVALTPAITALGTLSVRSFGGFICIITTGVLCVYLR